MSEDIATDFELELSSGGTFNLYNVLENGPVILNFIIGTWCPTCQAHLAKMRLWSLSNTVKKVTILVICAQPMDAIRDYLKDNPTSYLFASDEDLKVIKLFGLKMPMMKMSRPATILIDQDKTIKMKHTGMRGAKLQNIVENKVKNNS